MRFSADRPIQSKFVSGIASFFDANRRYPFITLSMGLFFLWLNLTMGSPAGTNEGRVLFRTIDAIWLVSAVFYLLGYAAVVFSFRQLIPLFEKRWWIPSVCVAMALGVAGRFAATWLDLAEYSFVAECACAAAACFLTAFIMVVGTSAESLIGSKNTIFVCSGGMILAAFVLVAVNAAGGLLRWAILFAIPCMMAFTNTKIFSTISWRKVFRRGIDAKLVIPAKLVLVSVSHGIVCGLLLFLLSAHYDAGFVAGRAVFPAMLVAACIAISAFVAYTGIDFDCLIFKVAFPLMAAGLLLIASAPGNHLAGCAVVAVGYCFLHMVMCGICSYIARHFEMPPFWVLSLTTLFFVLGQIAGVFAGGLAFVSGVSLESVSLSVLAIVFIACVYLQSGKNVRYGWGVVRPCDDDVSEDPLEFAVHTVATDDGFTARELQVALLLAKNLSRKQIAEQLVLSEETVKTHVKHIYQKAGIHSKEEYLNMLESRMRSLGE